MTDKQWQTTFWVRTAADEEPQYITVYGATFDDVFGAVSVWLITNEPVWFSTHPAPKTGNPRYMDATYNPPAPPQKTTYKGVVMGESPEEWNARLEKTPWLVHKGEYASSFWMDSAYAFDGFLGFIDILPGPDFHNPLLDDNGDLRLHMGRSSKSVRPGELAFYTDRGWVPVSTDAVGDSETKSVTTWYVVAHPDPRAE